MNIRKPVDYNAMFTALDALMMTGLPQMELYCEIGRLVSGRAEKGAAVAASEYLCGTYPDISGFSPRNLRRMREFYRTYNDAPEVLAQAMTIGWTQNVVILDADLTLQERDWYIRAVGQFGWSKLELQRQIAANAHLENALDIQGEVCYTDRNHIDTEYKCNDENTSRLTQQYLQNRVCDCHHRGDRQPGLSSGSVQAGRIRDRLPGSCCLAVSGRRLWVVRPPDWDKPGWPPGYAPHRRRRHGRPWFRLSGGTCWIGLPCSKEWGQAGWVSN